MLEFGMNPQQALDAARIYVEYKKKGKLVLKNQINVSGNIPNVWWGSC